MSKSLSQRRPLLFLAGLLSLLLILMSYQVRTGEGDTVFEKALLNAAGPLVRAGSGSLAALADFWHSYAYLRGTHQENILLRARLAHMEELGRQGEEFRLENGRLREMLGLQKDLQLPSLAAEVLTLGSSGQARMALINRGSLHGVRHNMPVVNRQGVVGRVIAVGRSVAKVQLIIDPSSGVAGIFQRTRGQGMVLGMGERGCRMDYVSDLESVEVGDVVVTSGLDEIFPKGITLGVVRSVEEGDQLTKNIVIQPEVDFHRLEEVLVLLTLREPEPELELGR